MFLYAVLLENENQEVANLIMENYPGSYPINNTGFLVRTADLSDTVASNVGIKGDTKMEGRQGLF